ncbi:MAG: hypothetical protein ACLGHN_03575 [Bacteriovoracia bacterium]
MTIGVVVSVPDGIALSADTQTSWTTTITKAEIKDPLNAAKTIQVDLAKPILQQSGWSSGTKKLFKFKYGSDDQNLKDAAILTAGNASINGQTAYAVLKKIEASCPRTDSCDAVVAYIVDELKKEFKLQYKVDDMNKMPKTISSFIFASFENSDITKPYISNNNIITGPLLVGQSDHHINSSITKSTGCTWIGRVEYIGHILNHSNANLPPIAGQYHLMTLQDAVRYSRFLTEFTCDFQKYAVCVPDCGRPVVLLF